MNARRRWIMALLALGTVGGYASGAMHLAYGGHCRHARRERMIDAFAERCAEAALRANPHGRYDPTFVPPPVPR